MAEQLGNLLRFNEELLTALAVPAYYNEALGSTCQITAYDRVRADPAMCRTQLSAPGNTNKSSSARHPGLTLPELPTA